MKGIFKASVIGLAFATVGATTGALAQGTYTTPSPDSTYTQTQPARDARRIDNRRFPDAREVDSTWHGATAAPYYPGDDVRNANSALWGVGG
jgi:hypothetical protein